MAEILTESFCERCGTRYTFEVAAPRSTRVGRLRLLSKGLRNYVMHDESSLGDAFAAAESDEDRERASQQLDAFHKTFNFCMSCRQYTCGNCWNEAEGRCLTCAPQLGREILPAFVGSDGYVPDQPTTTQEQPTIAASAWPTVDLPSQPEPIEPVALVEPATEVEREPRAVAPEPTLLEPALSAQAPAEEIVPEPARPAAETTPIEVAAAAEVAAAESVAAESVAAETSASAAAEVAAAAEHPAPVEPAEPLEPTLAPTLTASAQLDQAEPVAASALLGAAPEAPSGVEAVAEATEEPAPSSPESEELPPEVAAARGASQTHGLFARFRPGTAAEPAEQVAPTPLDRAALTSVEAEPQSRAALGAGAPDTAEAAASFDMDAGQVPAAELAPEVTADLAAAVPPAGEPALAEAQPTATTEPAQAEPEPVEPEPAIAASAAPAEPEPASGEQPLARPPVDIVSQPVWSRIAPETAPAPATPAAPTPAPAVPTPPPAAAAPAPIAPQTGAAPAWPAPLGSAPAWPPAPPPAPTGVQWPQAAAPSETVWAESSRDVLNRPGSGVQACVSCGLPLSATARFCRRCGSRQG